MKPLYEFEFKAMTSPCKISIYEGNSEQAKACFEEIKKSTLYLEKKYNFYDPLSYLSTHINQRKKNKIKIDERTANILEKVFELSKVNNEHFDITIGTLKAAYKKTSLQEMQDELNKLEDKTGLDTWNLNKRHLSFKYSETLLDLGGVIKEYAVDEAANIVRKNKINSAIINFGGDIFCVGGHPKNGHFNIAIKNPIDPSEKLLVVQLKNQALTTSASYERSDIIEGKKFSHIISKDTQEKQILSSTIISDSALKSGVYSTSFMISTNIEIPDDLKVVLIDQNLQVHQNLNT